MNTKTKKSKVNPVDAEITEIMNAETKTKNDKSTFQKAVQELNNQEEAKFLDQTDIKEPENETAEVKQIVLPLRYCHCEVLYLVQNDLDGIIGKRKEMVYDFTEILLDLETVLCIEKVFEDRLMDFGLSEEDIKEFQIDIDNACIIHCSAFTDPIIVLDYNFEDFTAIIIQYRNERS